MVADVGCFTDLASCADWNAQQEASAACSSQVSCSGCLANNSLCMWLKDGSSCFMGANFWGPPDLVVRQGQVCPGVETCESCVAQNRSWQVGSCNPDSFCIVADAGCFTDHASCADWNAQQEASAACSSQVSCSGCLANNSLCMWSKDDSSCFMGADFWGPPDLVVRQGQVCPGAETCESCVAQNRSWQVGSCNPDSFCIVADAGCFTDLASCADWNAQQEASAACSSEGSCSGCLARNPLCTWLKDGSSCFMGANFWGSPDLVVQQGEVCPGAETCESCVSQNRSWQVGSCNPDSFCIVADAGCFRDLSSCADWNAQQEASTACSSQGSCSGCLARNPLCTWLLDGSSCFMGANFWGSPDMVVQQGQRCPVYNKEEMCTAMKDRYKEMSCCGTKIPQCLSIKAEYRKEACCRR